VLGWVARAGGTAVARDGEAIVFAIPLGASAEQRRAAFWSRRPASAGHAHAGTAATKSTI
jgi:hypothetical protein